MTRTIKEPFMEGILLIVVARSDISLSINKYLDMNKNAIDFFFFSPLRDVARCPRQPFEFQEKKKKQQ